MQRNAQEETARMLTSAKAWCDTYTTWRSVAAQHKLRFWAHLNPQQGVCRYPEVVM